MSHKGICLDKSRWQAEEPEVDDNWENRKVGFVSLMQDISNLVSMESMYRLSFLFFSDYVTIDLTIFDNSGLVSDTMLKFSYFYFLSLLSFHLSLLSISKVSKYVLNISINIFCFPKAYIWIWSLLPENQFWVSSVSYVYSSWHTIIWRLLFLC